MKITCPHCTNDSSSMIEQIAKHVYICMVCSKKFIVKEN